MCFSRLLLILAIVAVLPLHPARAGVAVEERALFSSACQHYINRARFLDRTGNEPFVATLADACEMAMASLESASDEDHRRSVNFLSRLATLRQTITEMTMSRVFGDDYRATDQPKVAMLAHSGSLGSVSETGEYLIAYRLGVVSAYYAWLDTEAAIAFASRRGIVQ